jgi:hypothetical protein
MINFRRLATSLVAMAFVISFTSCEKQPEASDLQEVSFNVHNLTNSLSKKDTGPKDTIPSCSDASATHVLVKISGGNLSGAEWHTLKVLQNYDGGTQTEVIKLDKGIYTLEQLLVKDVDGNIIWVSPAEGSYYESLWGLNGVSKEFEIESFKKHKVDVDVLCWEPYSYKDFGFSWYDFNKIKVKTLCFFGDVCVDNHEEWHADGSPYAGQLTYEGYDFPAIFRVEIRPEGGGDIINDVEYYSNESWFGEGKPLCIEFPDIVDQDDNYTFTIFLMKPDGTSEEIISENFTAEEDPVNVTGDDGVYDFVWGDCDTPPGDDTASGCETAYAKFDKTWDYGLGYVFTDKESDNPEDYPSLGIGTRWGWAGNFTYEGDYEFTVEFWAAAGKNYTSSGTLVGDVTYKKIGDNLTVTYNLDSGFTFEDAHTFAGTSEPTTTASGQFGYVKDDFENGVSTHTFEIDNADAIWFISHATVCGDFPDDD